MICLEKVVRIGSIQNGGTAFLQRPTRSPCRQLTGFHWLQSLVDPSPVVKSPIVISTAWAWGSLVDLFFVQFQASVESAGGVWFGGGPPIDIDSIGSLLIVTPDCGS